MNEDLPSYGADFIATDEDRARLDARRDKFEQETPWKIDDFEITDTASLLGALMTRNARDLAWTRDCIEDGLRSDVVRLAAWRMKIMEKLVTLCQGDQTPNPMRILVVLSDGCDSLDMLCDRYLREQEEN